MKANQADYPVQLLCRLLNVSRSGYYAWRDRPLSARARSDMALTALIHQIHRRSRGAYGAPPIHAELADDHRGGPNPLNSGAGVYKWMTAHGLSCQDLRQRFKVNLIRGLPVKARVGSAPIVKPEVTIQPCPCR